MWTQTNPVRAPEAILPPTNHDLPNDQIFPADIPTEQAVIRRGGILGTAGTHTPLLINQDLTTLAAKREAPTKLPTDLVT